MGAIVNGAPLHDFPRYDVTAPYLRQLAGPMDYTPGSYGKCHLFLAPLRQRPPHESRYTCTPDGYVHRLRSTLADACRQSQQIHEGTECTDFIAKVPTTFDETIALDGKIAEYITIARRKGNTWFVGSMTN